MFFVFFKLYKWYQIAQSITYELASFLQGFSLTLVTMPTRFNDKHVKTSIKSVVIFRCFRDHITMIPESGWHQKPHRTTVHYIYEHFLIYLKHQKFKSIAIIFSCAFSLPDSNTGLTQHRHVLKHYGNLFKSKFQHIFSGDQ